MDASLLRQTLSQMYQACWKPHSASLICSNPLKFMLGKAWTTQIQKSHVHEHNKIICASNGANKCCLCFNAFPLQNKGNCINNAFIFCDGKLRVILSLSEDNVLVPQIKDSCPTLKAGSNKSLADILTCIVFFMHLAHVSSHLNKASPQRCLLCKTIC